MNKIILLAVVSLLAGCAGDKTISPGERWKVSEAFYSDSVVCSLKASTTAVFRDEKLSVESGIDKEATVLTFIDLNSNTPAMVGNLGDKSTLLKNDQGSTLYLIESTGLGNMNIFTLFRDKNIMLMSKQYDFFGTPFGLLMIGDCLSGS